MPSPCSHKLPNGSRRLEAANSTATRHFRVPANPAQLQRVRGYVEEAAAQFGLGGIDRFQVVFAVNEAVTNAIRYGSPERDATVGVQIDVDGDTLICSVRDSGAFAPSPSETDEFAERGRGLTLMALFMDEVEIATEPDGTTVRLHKRRSA
jgi:anti-sigma regulatory factor (Ser/Thr protein kinase)